MKKIIIIIYALCAMTILHADNRVMRWEAVPNARAYRVQIRDLSGKIIVTEETAKPEYRITLSSGKYEYRVTALNKPGQPGTSSAWTPFEIRIVSAPEMPSDTYTIASINKDGETEEDVLEEIERDDKSEKESAKADYKYSFMIAPSLFLPAGVMGSLFETGYGINIRAGVQNVLFPGTEGGLFTAFFYLPGNSEEEIDYALHFPLGLYGGYHIPLKRKITLFPNIRMGMTYTKATYLEPDLFESDTVIDPLFSFGIEGQYGFSNYLMLAGIYGSILIEEEGLVPCFEGLLGIGYVF
ncbi:MAG: hypothetical protein JXR90_11905 [Spirochaetes bacterium]|nr:hypothetical protein [Spirochaetota bacterium]